MAGKDGASGCRRATSKANRHAYQQIQQLEAFFKHTPHPDEIQRRQLARELGLLPRQIKFWFQNKRTQTKALEERAKNLALRQENEKLKVQNFAMGLSLKSAFCPSCGGPPYEEQERRQLNMQKLQLENDQLKEEYGMVASLICKYIGVSLGNVE